METGGWAGRHIRSFARMWKEFAPLVLRRPRGCTKPRTPRSPILFCAGLLPFLTGCMLLVPRSGLNWGKQSMPFGGCPWGAALVTP